MDGIDCIKAKVSSASGDHRDDDDDYVKCENVLTAPVP